MDLEELQSNLHSLKQLYELLQNGLPNSVFNTLDDKSRLLLKYLLDRAAENVFIIHSKVLEARAGSSVKGCSERAQKVGDLQIQLPTSETSDVLPVGRTGKKAREFTGSGNDFRFREPRIQRLPSVKPTLSVGTSGSEDMHKYCRVCQRRVVKPSVESSTFGIRNSTKTSALSENQKCLSSSFLCIEGKGKLRSPVSFSKSPGDTEDSEHRGSTYLDCISSGSGSTDYSSNKLADGVEVGPVRKLTKETAQQNDCLSYLSKQASGVIKQIEVRILDLQRVTQDLETSEISTRAPYYNVQQELSDRMNGIILQPESTSNVVVEKPLMLARNKPSKTEFYATDINGLQLEIDDKLYEGTSPVNHLSCMTTDPQFKMQQPRLIAELPLKLLPLKKTMTSPGLQLENRNLYEETKRLNHMMDWTAGQKVKSSMGNPQPYYATSTDQLSERVSDQMNELDQYQTQAVLEESIMKPEARLTPNQFRIHKDYLRNQNIRALDSRDTVDEFLGSRRKGGLSREVKKFQHSLQHKANQYGSRRTFHRQHESDTSLSSVSSKWKRQKTSTSYCGSEEYYPRHETQRQNYVKSPTNSESEVYSLSGDDSRDFYKGVSSSNDDDVYSWLSNYRPYKSTSCASSERKKNSLSSFASSSEASYSGDDETEGCSPYCKSRFQHRRQPRDFSVGSTSAKKTRPRGDHASTGQKTPGKKIGRWKKFKDKLSVIFHHHHHHHHHIYNQQTDDDDDDDDDDLSSSENRKACGKLPSKHIATSSPILKPDADERQALEKIENAVVHGRDGKKQQKPVNPLIGRLFKHARRAKRSKPSRNPIKPLRDSQYGKKKTPAKLNWLKMLQRHKKAKKLRIGYRKR